MIFKAGDRVLVVRTMRPESSYLVGKIGTVQSHVGTTVDTILDGETEYRPFNKESVALWSRPNLKEEMKEMIFTVTVVRVTPVLTTVQPQPPIEEIIWGPTTLTAPDETRAIMKAANALDKKENLDFVKVSVVAQALK